MNTPITSTGESSLGGHRSVDAGFFPDYSEAGLSVLKRRHFRESRKGLGKMKKLRFLLFMVLVLIAHPRVSQCDVSQDETVDVHFVTNEVPGLFPCKVNFYSTEKSCVRDVQRVIMATLGQACDVTPQVSLTIMTTTIMKARVSKGTGGLIYSARSNANGGALPSTLPIPSGSLSVALNLSSSPAISGTPSSEGPYTLTTEGAHTNQNAATSCDLYVSPTGSDLNSGTVTAPWQTVQHAFDNVQPGQTVCFRTGTYPMTVSSGYNQRLNNSGTSSSLITFTNYPGEVAIIHGNTLVAGAYVTFVGTPAVAPGFIFEGPTGQALDIVDILNTHDVTFDHVEIRNGDYHAALYQSGGYNIKLIGCYVHDNGRPGYINSDQGIYWDATTGGGNLIANCVVEHNVSAGIQLYPSPSQVTVEENTIVNNGNYGAVVYGDQNAIVNNIFSDNGVIANNPQMEVHSGTNKVIDSNIFWSSTASLQGYINLTNVPVTHSLNTNPLFVDPANHNYHLQAGSPAIKAGNASYALPEDKDGVQRDSLSDLGAYVYTPPPIVAVGGVVDPWTSASGLAPGSWITIYGKNFGVTSASWNPVPGGPLPTSLGGVGVQVSGLPAALSFINATQINALVPAAVTPGLAQVIVSKNGVAANPVAVSVDPQRPVVYAVMDPEHIGNYYVTAALAGTSDLIGKPGIDPRVTRGARPGESVDFYLTGLGATADPSAFVTDQLFTSAAPVAATVTIQLGSQKIAPSFAGLTAPGLYLVRAVIPASIAPGDQLIQFDANGFLSPGQVYLTISPL